MTTRVVRLARSLFIVGLAMSGSACDAILGLDEKALDAGPIIEAGAREGGPHDAAVERESGEASLPPGAAVAVVSSYENQDWCVVRADGSVWCWGDDEGGQLGNDSGLSSLVPLKVPGLPPIAQVGAGVFTVCALSRNGGVWCWGSGEDGELGAGSTTTMTSTPVQVSGLASGVVALSVGSENACAIKEGGSVWCWGVGGYGQLGTGSLADAFVPAEVVSLTSGVTSVSVGDDTTCVVQDGGVLCWGANSGFGELGNGTNGGSLTPVPVPSLKSGVTSVSLGQGFACALTDQGGVQCWGYGLDGELGNNDFASSPVPVEVDGLTSGVLQISAGTFSACAIEEDRSVACWGYGDDGELGNDIFALNGISVYQSPVPVKVKGIVGDPTHISTGNSPCIVTSDGHVQCWGQTSETALSPVSVMNEGHDEGPSTSIYVGGNLDTLTFACDLTSTGLIECWGGNEQGELGNGSYISSNVPVPVSLIGASAMATGPGADFACAVTSGLVKCWGNNQSGQLGTTSVKSSSSPLAIPALSSVASVAVGALSACALTTAGGVWCWGDNGYGELGDGTTTSSPVPVPVEGLGSGVVAISAGVFDACAVLAEGTVECWGNNNNGELGNGSEMIALTPTPVVGITNAVGVSIGWYSGCAVTAAGTVKCWGDNNYGELGNNTTTTSFVPVTVSAISGGATSVSVGEQSACAIVTGAVYCWGSSALGNGYSVETLTPIQVIGLTSGVTSIAVSPVSACAVVSGSMQCWGSNSAGQLGIGAAPNAFQATTIAGFP